MEDQAAPGLFQREPQESSVVVYSNIGLCFVETAGAAARIETLIFFANSAGWAAVLL